MRYSVVLPRIDPADSEAVRQALEQARVAWARGAHPEAVELVRAASEAARAAGSAQRALTLEKAAGALRRQIEPQTAAASAVTAAPPRVRQKLALAETAPGRPVPQATDRPKRASARPRSAVPRDPVISERQSAASERQPASSERQTVGARRPQANAEPPAVSAERLAATAPVEDGELVVTVAPSDWKLPSREALVGRRAVRVAIVAGKGGAGTITVRPLAAGEVAPEGAQVALLVALEPDAFPLPRTA